MLKNSNSKSKNQPITEEQIRAKAHELWQARNRQAGSSEDDWKRALEELEMERSAVKRAKYQLHQGFQAFWNWTGFKEKKLWDFMQLLFVPIVLALVGLGIQEFAKSREHDLQEAKERQLRQQQDADKAREQQLADDKAGQGVLINYLNEMATFLQEDALLTSDSKDEAFLIAQSKTITALQSLDPRRQQTIIQFLESANLNSLDKGKGLLYKARMSKVDFRKGDLSGCTLKEVNISLAKLSGIDLSGCTLTKSDLSGSDLTSAKLGGANLRGSNLKSTGLVNSDLRIALLNDANLDSANLDGANLDGAILTGANLTKAKNVTDEQLFAAKLCKTKLPNNSFVNPDRDCSSLARKNELNP